MAFLRVDFFSDALGMCSQMQVILPETQRYDPAIGFDRPYPVLYLLHGMGNDHTAWARLTSIERYAREYKLAVIMPATHHGWYTDMYCGYDYWTFLSEELPQICLRFFPHISSAREDTFAAGVSMGGYGALKCGILAPKRFGRVASLSGATDLASICADLEDPDGYWETIFGPVKDFAGSINDLHAQARRLAASGEPKPEIYMWCGQSDALLTLNTASAAYLKNLGFAVNFTTSPGGHEWKCWDVQIEKVLDWLPVEKIGGWRNGPDAC